MTQRKSVRYGKTSQYDTRKVNSCDLTHFLFRAKNLYVFVIWLDKSRAD